MSRFSIDHEHRVFVYGSLMKGFHNHPLLRGSQYLGPAMTLECEFAMYDYGSFPAVVGPDSRNAPKGRDGIVGELYAVTDATLNRLDGLEGHPRWYRRETIDMDCGEMSAWMYIMADAADLAGLSQVDNGDWRSHYLGSRAKA